MDKKQAQDLIRETFEKPFDKGRFVGFTKNLLNHIEEVTFQYSGNYIRDAFKQYIKSLERIGKFQDANGNKIDILIVHLMKETSLERARTMQRNYIAGYLNGSRGDELKDAALVAFVSPNEEDWRFSLVKMEYKFEETSDGRVKVKEEFTPARRYSFLVGENENSHTAQSNLFPILKDDAHDPVLMELEDAFGIEKVTKEFFEKYRELFFKVHEALEDIYKKNNKVKNDFDTKGVNTVDFAKKLLGQIVFLYFLQKKGWFGVGRDADWGTGPKNFLRRLFCKEHSDYGSFFNEILEPLFYEALATERPGDYFSHFNCKIPFLNGGLFDPLNDYDWIHVDILLPNELFSNEVTTKEGDIGNGILDVFDRYNFTVKEDEPLEKEVAVDPEMLGKVFENLLEVKDRKSKGTYYTPREIVHYMCQESLVNYLSTELEGDVNADDIRLLIKHGETTVEHDARVVKAEKETERYRHKIAESIRENANIVDEKLANIRVCDPAVGSGAFLVGMMSEIVQARDSLTNYISEKSGRSTYNFKRHAIHDCLYGVDIDSGAVEIAKLRLWLSLVVEEEDIKQIKPLPNLDYKIVCGNSLLGVEKDLLNVHFFKELESFKESYFNETNINKKHEFKGKIDELIHKITNENELFDFEIYFSEVFDEKDGFDVVIANPPYGIVYDKKLKQSLLASFSCFKRNNDIYIAFYKQGLGLLKQSGILIYISPNTFLNGDYFKEFRNQLTSTMVIKEIFDLKELPIFDDPTVFVCILCCQNQQNITFPYEYRLRVAESSMEIISDEKVKINEPTMNSLKIDNLLYLKLISQDKVSLAQELFHIKDVGFNYWTKGRGKKRGGDSIGKRVFYSGKQKDKKDRPFLKGKNISRYYFTKPSNFLIHDYQRLLDPKIDTLRFTSSFLERKPKIIYRQTANKIVAALDMQSHYLDKTVHLIVNKDSFSYLDLRYVLGLLNSLLFYYLYAYIAQERKGRTFAQVKTTYIKNLPIKNTNDIEQKPFIDIVDKILQITKDDDYTNNTAKQTQVKEYEKQIDQMVYELYELTEEEIRIVEEGNNK